MHGNLSGAVRPLWRNTVAAQLVYDHTVKTAISMTRDSAPARQDTCSRRWCEGWEIPKAKTRSKKRYLELTSRVWRAAGIRTF
jgi:hypothetical protein